MAEKRRHEPWHTNDDESEEDEESVRDSLDLDRETEERRLQELTRFHAALAQREDMVAEVAASFRDPRVVRTVALMINLGLVSTSNEVIRVLQTSMRDIEERARDMEEKERQEAERRRRNRRLREEGEAEEEEGARRRSSWLPVRPSAPPPQDMSAERNRDEFNLNLDAMVLRSQEDFSAGRSSFSFDNAPNPVVGGGDNVDDVEEVSEEKKAEQARLLAQIQSQRSSSASIFGPLGFRDSQPRNPSLNDNNSNVVDLTGEADNDNEEEKKHRDMLLSLYRPNPGGLSLGSSPPPSILRRSPEERKAADLFNILSFNAPRHPTILERLDEERKAREEKKAAEPSPLSRANVPSVLFGSPLPSADSQQQHPLYQDVINSDRSIADQIRNYFRRDDGREEAEERPEDRLDNIQRQHTDFEWDEMIIPSPIPEEVSDDDDDDSSSSSSSSSSSDDEEDNA